MFRNLLIAMIVGLFAGILVYVKESSEDKFDFRKATWGMSKEQVKLSEDIEPVLEEEYALMYNTSVSNMECRIVYLFLDYLLLTSGSYTFVEKHSDEINYIMDYNDVKDRLVEKYGTPKSTDVNWSNDLYQDEPEHHGLAVCLGHLAFMSTWETDSTDIVLSLSGDYYDISHRVSYRSKVGNPKLKKIKERKSKSDF